jgi:predicted dehydrogenase
MFDTPLRVGVVGVGSLGRHHARILAALDGVRIAGVVDIDRERADAVAQATGAPAMYAFHDLFDRVDAVTLAVPTILHRDMAVAFLDRGTPVLVEKPIAASIGEADDILAAAERSGAVLAVGHTERYNPAVAAVGPLLTAPRFIEVHRLGVFPDRSLDIDVVFDVMIHDLDIVTSIVRAPVTRIEAVGVPVLTPRVDIANVRLRFDDGCIANLTASRISRDRVRKMRFFQPDAYISIDFAAREAEAWRLVRREGREPAIEGGKLPVAAEEPLARELADFVDAVRHGRSPLVTGEQGREALRLAEQIAEEIKRNLQTT